MRFVIDMNIGPEWIACLESGGWQAVHWSSVGSHDADDSDIMQWARDHDYVVLTADLDFGTRLVRSGANTPSVVQLRTEETLVRVIGATVLSAVERARSDLAEGALVTIEDARLRIRRLNSADSL